MNKSNKSAKSRTGGTYTQRPPLTKCAPAVNSRRLEVIRRALESCWSSCSPLDHPRVRHYLELDSGPDFMLVEAWRRCGRNDHTRTLRLEVGPQARRTMTPMGFACLIAYCQAWIDAEEVRVATAPQVGPSLSPAADGASRCPDQDPPPPLPARGSATRTRRSSGPKRRPKNG